VSFSSRTTRCVGSGHRHLGMLLRRADCQPRLTLIERRPQRISNVLERRNLRVDLSQAFRDHSKEREFVFGRPVSQPPWVFGRAVNRKERCDLSQTKTKSLSVTDELYLREIRFSVRSVTAGRSRRARQESTPLVEENGLHVDSRAGGQLTNTHPQPVAQ